MGIIFKLAIRNMKRRKARYILTMCTLVIGVALFGGILIARDSFKVMFVNDIDKRMGTADILVKESELQDGWFKADKLKEIEKVGHVTEVSYRIAGFDVYTSAIPGGNQIDNSTITAVYGIDIDSRDEEELGGNPYILESDISGKTFEELLDHGGDIIVITESLQIKLGKNFEAGDEIFVLPIDYHLKIGMDQDIVSANTNLWPKFKVVAIVRDLGEARDFDPETPDEYSSPSSGPCIFASIDITHKLVDGIIDRTDQYTLAAIGVDDVNNVKSVVDDIEDELDETDWSVADLKTDIITEINDSVDLMMTILLMFAVIALILSIILILNIFNIIKEEQEYETGMLQAVGASKSETFKLFLIQGAIMGVIGAIIGTICSYFMSYLIFYMTVESLKNMPGEFGEMFAETEFEILVTPQTLLITLSVGMISCLLAAIYPSWKASRKPLIECLNPLGKKSEREKKHFKRKIAFMILASLLIAYGVYLLYSVSGYGPENRGNGDGMAETTTSIIAPTFILLGLIGLTAIFVGPIASSFIKIFSPYLKQTKLLTKKNVLRHRKRTILTYSMISLTVSYLIGISVIMGSFREGIHTTVTDVMGCDIRVVVANTPRSFEDKLEDVEGVEDVMGITHGNVRIWDKTQDKWVGHGLLEKDWDESVELQVMDTDKVEEHMKNTEILKPSDMTLEAMMDDLSEEYTMIITEAEADDFNLDVGDETLVMFSVGYTYPNVDAMLEADTDNAQEDVVIANMEVVAIVKKFQGFATGEIIGQQEGVYNLYISWQTWEKLARENLPAGNTDIIFRQKTQSGDSDLDNALANWFNFSDVLPILNSINGIDYYTTRMEYISPTYDLFPLNPYINLTTSVVGIRTNYSDDFKSDAYFGRHTLVEKSSDYSGTTMEEILNNETANICVVDQTYVNNMKVIDPSFGINSTITIFKQQFVLDTISSSASNTFISLENGTIKSGTPAYFTIPDNSNMTFASNKTSLEFNITVNTIPYILTNYINPYNILIETLVNSSVNSLNLEVYNYYTKKFDNLGSINNTNEQLHSFTFNQYYLPYSYIDQTSGNLKFRVIGSNYTYDSDFSLDIDFLNLIVLNSTDSLNGSLWQPYKVVGIIQDPTLYNTERYNWLAGYEVAVDVAETENSVYINYEKARNQVYVQYNGSINNGTNDLITHVFIHCKSVDDISAVASTLRSYLGSNYTVVDLKSKMLEYRTYAVDWYVWIEEGYDDEEVLEEITEYLEDHGYVVLFALTNSYITQIFESMIDLITLIMNGILVFAIMIAMIGLALHSLLSTMARRREIGMLRSIGLSKKGVIRTISGETIVISFLGTIIGILAGLLTGFLMVSSIPDTGFLTVTLTIPWLTIGILVLVTLATAILSSRYPSRWAANINIIDAVRTR